MSITSTDKIFEVADSEYAYNVKAFKPVCSGKTLSIHVPKIMGSITLEGNQSIVVNGLFDNATACKPTYATKVKCIKAITATLKENCNWLDKVNSSGTVPKNSMFNVEFLNNNIQTPYITTK